MLAYMIAYSSISMDAGQSGVTLFSTGVIRLVVTHAQLYLLHIFLHIRLCIHIINVKTFSSHTQAKVFLLHLRWWTGKWRYVFRWTSTPFLPSITYFTPLSLRSGIPPWNNDKCKIDIASQLATVNPMPKPGGKNAWHAAIKQVREIGG